MKRYVLFGLFLVFLSGSLATASDTRLETMGMGDFYYNFTPLYSPNCIIKDEANIGMYPSTVNYYPKYFFAEVHDIYDDAAQSYGVSDVFYKAGAIFPLGTREKPWVLGAHFSTVPYQNPLFTYVNQRYLGTNHKIDLYYGRYLGGNPFGFTFGYYGSSEENKDTTTINNYEQSLARYELGFGVSLMSQKLDLAFMLAFDSWKTTAYQAAPDAIVDLNKPSGGTDITIRGRYWMGPYGKYTLIPHAAFIIQNYGRENYFWDAANSVWALWSTNTIDQSIIELGFGVNYDATTDVLVAADCGIAFVGYKTETDYEDNTLNDDVETKYNYSATPYFRLGIDAKVFKWMDFRAGVISIWAGRKYELNTTASEFVETWTHAETFLGAGFHWGKFMIDASIDPKFLLNGPYFVSGEPTDNEYDTMAMRASVTYWFDED